MRERGFAMLMVLWTLVILALLAAQFTTNGRGAARTAADLHAATVAEVAADGAIHHAMLQLTRGEQLPDGPAYQVRVGDTSIMVHISNERRKINPNAANRAVSQDLLRRLGVSDDHAAQIAQAIVDWRSPGPRSASGSSKAAQYRAAGLTYAPTNHGFDSVAELGLVVGMTPAVMSRLKPFVSVFPEGDGPEFDDPRASADPWSMGSGGRVMVVAIEAAASGSRGGRFTRRAVARLRADPGLGQAPFEVLTWDMAD